jgi:hypothetical protein
MTSQDWPAALTSRVAAVVKKRRDLVLNMIRLVDTGSH